MAPVLAAKARYGAGHAPRPYTIVQSSHTSASPSSRKSSAVIGAIRPGRTLPNASKGFASTEEQLIDAEIPADDMLGQAQQPHHGDDGRQHVADASSDSAGHLMPPLRSSQSEPPHNTSAMQRSA